MVGTLPAGTLAEPHTIDCEKEESKKRHLQDLNLRLLRRSDFESHALDHSAKMSYVFFFFIMSYLNAKVFNEKRSGECCMMHKGEHVLGEGRKSVGVKWCVLELDEVVMKRMPEPSICFITMKGNPVCSTVCVFLCAQ